MIMPQQMTAGRARINVALLTLCQALTMTGNNILATTASLVGFSLLIVAGHQAIGRDRDSGRATGLGRAARRSRRSPRPRRRPAGGGRRAE
jgi:hypothetical protein